MQSRRPGSRRGVGAASRWGGAHRKHRSSEARADRNEVLGGADGSPGGSNGRSRHGAVEHVDDIYDALAQNGLTEKTIVDPAFGGWSEAKTLEDDRETFERLREFRGYGQPILVSINRKNFLRELAGRDTEDALPVSLAATAMAVERGAHVVRTHDVAETLDAVTIGDRFTRDRLRDRDAGVEELDVTTPREAARHLDRTGADADPAAAVMRVFELADLSAGERDALGSLVATHPGVEVAEGPTETLLFGSVASLRSLAADVEHDALAARLAAVRAATA